jgi:hypothetical protein
LAHKFLNKYLGEDFESDILKSEAGAIVKQGANVGVLPHEIYVSLQIVPRTIISLLVQHLKPLKAGETTDIPWPTESGAIHNININKISSDLYSGHISGEGKSLCRFNYRSLPAVGLVIMSTYELYDKETNQQDLRNPDIDYDKVQRVIDERIRMQHMVEDVVTRKMTERDALQQLITQKIQDYLRTSESVKQSILEPEQNEPDLQESEYMEESTEEPHLDDAEDIDIDKEVIETVEENTKESKKGKLKEFLDKKVKKTEKVFFTKKEIDCPYCAKKLYKGEDSINLCLCYGESYGQDLKITKSDKGYSFKYPKKFSLDNAQMLLDCIKKNK